ncbi:MAG: hypothetical protein V4594_12685 [Bacteroidota bacterium]
MNVDIDNSGKINIEDLLAILQVGFINHMKIYWKDAVNTQFEIVKKKIVVRIPIIYDGIALTITVDPDKIYFSEISGANILTELEKLRNCLIDFLSIPVVQ